jgi:NitT/TauT family transport system substrate-binding protein
MQSLRKALIVGCAATLAAGLSLGARAAPEMTSLTLGLPVTTSTFLPLYLAEEEGFFKDEGLDVKLVAFRGGTDLVRGMIAGAVQVGCTAFAGVSVGIKAKQPIKAFYGGFNMAIFDWYAVPSIKSLDDAKGKRFGVTRIGSSTDFLTRYALKAKGIDPAKEVQIIQGGGSGARMAAMEAGQLEVNVFAPPEKFMAADMGYNRIVTQKDMADDYPFHVFFAQEEFIKANPNTLRAVLRAHIRGVRLAKADRERAIKTLIGRIGMDPKYAGRTYDDFINDIHEDGRMPTAKGMQAFWGMGIDAGTYTEAWPESRYLDRTFIDSYATWKP